MTGRLAAPVPVLPPPHATARKSDAIELITTARWSMKAILRHGEHGESLATDDADGTDEDTLGFQEAHAIRRRKRRARENAMVRSRRRASRGGRGFACRKTSEYPSHRGLSSCMRNPS